MHTRTKLLAASLTLSLLVSACSGGGGGGDGGGTTSFTSFVKDLATTPVDDADPVAIDGLDFTFSENPAAFDALFQ
jgi:hypothetical protein